MNIINLVGNVVRDSELSSYGKGKDKVYKLSFTVACNKKFKNGEGIKEKVTFIPCQIWGDRGVNLEEYVTKGTLVSIVGELDLSSNENDDGTYSNYCNVLVNKLELLSSKKEIEEKKRKSK